MTPEREQEIRKAVAFGETQRTGKWFVQDLAELLALVDAVRAERDIAEAAYQLALKEKP